MKIAHLAVNMSANGGEIEVKEHQNMGGTDKKPEKGKTTKESGKKPSKVVEDDDDEDGDFATPKRDRDGDDDQPV